MNTLTIADKKLTITDISKLWLRYNKNSFKPNTFQKYKYHLSKYILNSSLAEKSLDCITSMELADFSEQLINKNLSGNTINDILLVMGAVIKYAHEFYDDELISVPFVKKENKEMRVLSKSEQIQFEIFLKQDMDICRFGVLLTLYTGVRIGELCALQWKDIKCGYININKTMYRIKNGAKTTVVVASPKTISSFRIIPIPSFLHKHLEKFRGDDDDYILGNTRTPIVEPRLMQSRFKKMTDHCNLQNVTFHTLRHTFATRCVECGFDIKSLSEILGHSDVKTTLNKYVHSSMEQKQFNMNKLAKIAE